jgi:D-alanine-D-alanine ligase
MDKKLKVGIFFGGPSREREISFLGGRTAYEHLDKRYFEPVAIFVDSIGNFIKVDPEEILYQSDIRSFYPSKNQNNGYKIYIESLGPLKDTQLYKLIYKIGSQVKIEDLKNHMDFAFVVMHGPYAEDGNIQGLLEWVGIPYMGPGILASGIGIDKSFQNKLLAAATGQTKKFKTISKQEWDSADKSKLFSNLISEFGFPLVIKAPHQGSSIGVSIVKKRSLEEFSKGMSQCFFETHFYAKEWNKLTTRQKKNQMEKLSNLDEGIGFPAVLNNQIIYHPAVLLKELDKHLKTEDIAVISSTNSEDHVLIEEFTTGQEFSCGVIQDDSGKAIALPPSEVYGDIQTFDFKSKYKSTASKKRIPVDTKHENLVNIHKKILAGFEMTNMNVISRIDGFLTEEDEVILHDPNTIPGMSPASFIFKQMAEIGFSITNSITYLIRQSIRERIRSGKNVFQLKQLLQKTDDLIAENKKKPRQKLAILFGENDEEYRIAQKKFGHYGGDERFEPIPICAAKNGSRYIIPLNLMFKPDINEFGTSIGKTTHPFIQENIANTAAIREFYIGDVNFKVSKISDMEFDSIFKATYNCALDQLEEV